MISYGLQKEDWERLQQDFIYHSPITDQAARYAQIRSKAKGLAEFIIKSCPKSRELSLALTKIEEAVFWANAAIARNEKE